MNRWMVTAAGVVLVAGTVGAALAQQLRADRYDANRQFNSAVSHAADEARSGANRPETARAEKEAQQNRESLGLGGKGPLSIGSDDRYASPTYRDGRIGVEITITTDRSRTAAQEPPVNAKPEARESRGGDSRVGGGFNGGDKTHTDGGVDRSNQV